MNRNVFFLLASLLVSSASFSVSNVSDNQDNVKRIKIEEVRDYKLPGSICEFNKAFGEGKAVDRPLLLKGAALNWPVRNSISFETLTQNFGKRLVNVYTNWGKDLAIGEIVPMTFGEHLQSIQSDPDRCGYLQGYSFQAFNITVPRDDQCGIPSDPSDTEQEEVAENVYLTSVLAKDAWFPTVKYGVVVLFIGGHSKTPFHQHQAVFLAQLQGKKKAYLIHPEHFSYLACKGNEEWRTCESLVDPSKPDFDLFPDFRGAEIFETEISEGDILLIPDRWFHHIEGIESPSLSLVHFSDL